MSSTPRKFMTTIHQFAESLSSAIDAKDAYTEKHSMEVAAMSRIIALNLGLGEELAAVIHIAGHLHDIGKIGVPDCILHKPGKLDGSEWIAICRHPQIGAAILRPVQEIESKGICEMVLYHHERYDGQGYPHALKGDEIPIGARIISVADSLSAMTGYRSYRPAKTFDGAVAEIVECSGTQFDPAVVDALCAVKEQVRETLFSIIGEENMSVNFQIESRTSNGDLHLSPRGDFDGTSAWELLNFIHNSYNGKGRVFIDTKHLNHLCSFGCNTFRCGLNFSLLPANRIFFKGKNGFEIAPDGSRVIVAPEKEKHHCSGNCKNCTCSSGKKQRALEQGGVA